MFSHSPNFADVPLSNGLCPQTASIEQVICRQYKMVGYSLQMCACDIWKRKKLFIQVFLYVCFGSRIECTKNIPETTMSARASCSS